MELAELPLAKLLRFGRLRERQKEPHHIRAAARKSR